MIAFTSPIHPFSFRVELTPAIRRLPLPGRWKKWWWEIMVRRYNPTADLLPGVRDPFLFRIPEEGETHTAGLLAAVQSDSWTTLGYEPGGSGGTLSFRRAILAADRAVWQFYTILSDEQSKGVKVR